MGKAKMAAVGERDVVTAFKAMGLAVMPAEQADEASRAVHRLAREGYAVIFVTERIAAMIPETLGRYQSEPTPAIIPIPGSRGSVGLGMARLRANVEKAIGADILFEKEG
jgi:V/A-type H+-transporting ATPase subunit F